MSVYNLITSILKWNLVIPHQKNRLKFRSHRRARLCAKTPCSMPAALQLYQLFPVPSLLYRGFFDSVSLTSSSLRPSYTLEANFSLQPPFSPIISLTAFSAFPAALTMNRLSSFRVTKQHLIKDMGFPRLSLARDFHQTISGQSRLSYAPPRGGTMETRDGGSNIARFCDEPYLTTRQAAYWRSCKKIDVCCKIKI